MRAGPVNVVVELFSVTGSVHDSNALLLAEHL